MQPLKKKVLFVCIHNSARSQMAEAFLNALAGERFAAESAGIEPGQLNRAVVAAMGEIGIDISRNKTKSVTEMVRPERHYDHVITVCDETSAERCPVLPGQTQRSHWNFPDPSRLSGTAEEQMIEVRKIRDAIKEKIEHWIKSPG